MWKTTGDIRSRWTDDWLFPVPINHSHPKRELIISLLPVPPRNNKQTDIWKEDETANVEAWERQGAWASRKEPNNRWEPAKNKTASNLLNYCDQPFYKGPSLARVSCHPWPVLVITDPYTFSYFPILMFPYVLCGLPCPLLKLVASEFPVPFLMLRISGFVGLPLSLEQIFSYQWTNRFSQGNGWFFI